MIICLGPTLPQASNDLPFRMGRTSRGNVWSFFRWGFPNPDVATGIGGLLHHPFTLAHSLNQTSLTSGMGGLVSVALSVPHLQSNIRYLPELKAWPLTSTLSFEARTFLPRHNAWRERSSVKEPIYRFSLRSSNFLE